MAPHPPFATRHPLLARALVSALVWMLLLPFPMWADPVFDSGAATVNVNGVLQTINVSGDNQVLQWQSFVIDAGDESHFNLGGASFNVLNVVDPTQAFAGGTEIYGILSSNGHVFLADPSGVLIGPGGMVDTPGFYAIGGTVLDPATGMSFLGGDVFDPNNLDVNATAPVIHQGTIKAGFGGKVALVGAALEQGVIDAPGVSVTGTISVPNGTLTLVSGQGDIKLVNLLSNVSVTFPGTTPGTTDLSNGIVQAGTVTGQGLDAANNPTGPDAGIGINLVAADVYALGVNTDGFATGGGNVTIQANTAQVNGKLDLTDPDAGDPKGNFQGPTTLTAAAGDLEIVANDIQSGDLVAPAGGVKLAADNDVAVGAVTAAQALAGSTNAIEMTAGNDVRASGKIEATTGDILVQADADNDMMGVIDVKDVQVNASDIVMTGPSVTAGNLTAVNGGIDLQATAGNVVGGDLLASDPLASAATGDAIRITANGNAAVPNDGFVSIQSATATKGDVRITADGADAAGVGIQSAGTVDAQDGGVVITATGGDVFMGSGVAATKPVAVTQDAVNIQSNNNVTVNGPISATSGDIRVLADADADDAGNATVAAVTASAGSIFLEGVDVTTNGVIDASQDAAGTDGGQVTITARHSTDGSMGDATINAAINADRADDGLGNAVRIAATNDVTATAPITAATDDVVVLADSETGFDGNATVAAVTASAGSIGLVGVDVTTNGVIDANQNAAGTDGGQVTILARDFADGSKGDATINDAINADRADDGGLNAVLISATHDVDVTGTITADQDDVLVLADLASTDDGNATVAAVTASAGNVSIQGVDVTTNGVIDASQNAAGTDGGQVTILARHSTDGSMGNATINAAINADRADDGGPDAVRITATNDVTATAPITAATDDVRVLADSDADDAGNAILAAVTTLLGSIFLEGVDVTTNGVIDASQDAAGTDGGQVTITARHSTDGSMGDATINAAINADRADDGLGNAVRIAATNDVTATAPITAATDDVVVLADSETGFDGNATVAAVTASAGSIGLVGVDVTTNGVIDANQNAAGTDGGQVTILARDFADGSKGDATINDAINADRADDGGLNAVLISATHDVDVTGTITADQDDVLVLADLASTDDGNATVAAVTASAGNVSIQGVDVTTNGVIDASQDAAGTDGGQVTILARHSTDGTMGNATINAAINADRADDGGPDAVRITATNDVTATAPITAATDDVRVLADSDADDAGNAILAAVTTLLGNIFLEGVDVTTNGVIDAQAVGTNGGQVTITARHSTDGSMGDATINAAINADRADDGLGNAVRIEATNDVTATAPITAATDDVVVLADSDTDNAGNATVAAVTASSGNIVLTGVDVTTNGVVDASQDAAGTDGGQVTITARHSTDGSMGNVAINAAINADRADDGGPDAVRITATNDVAATAPITAATDDVRVLADSDADDAGNAILAAVTTLLGSIFLEGVDVTTNGVIDAQAVGTNGGQVTITARHSTDGTMGNVLLGDAILADRADDGGTDAVRITATHDVKVNTANAISEPITAATGDVRVAADSDASNSGDAVLDALTATNGSVIVSGVNVTMNEPVSAGNNVTATAAGNMTASGAVNAGQNVNLTAIGGNLVTQSTVMAGQSVTEFAGGSLTALGPVTATNGSAWLQAGGNLVTQSSVFAGQAVTVTAGGSLTASGPVTAAGGAATLTANGGTAQVANVSGLTGVAITGNNIVVTGNSLSSGGALTVRTNVPTGTIDFRSPGTSNVAATGDVTLGADRTDIPTVATIFTSDPTGSLNISGFNVATGKNQKVTARDSINVNAGNLLTISDLGAINAITLNAAQIGFHDRVAGNVLRPDGSTVTEDSLLGALASSRLPDVVANTVTVTAGTVGLNGVFADADGSIGGLVGGTNPNAVVRRVLLDRPLTASDAVFGNTVLDLVAVGTEIIGPIEPLPPQEQITTTALSPIPLPRIARTRPTADDVLTFLQCALLDPDVDGGEDSEEAFAESELPPECLEFLAELELQQGLPAVGAGVGGEPESGFETFETEPALVALGLYRNLFAEDTEAAMRSTFDDAMAGYGTSAQPIDGRQLRAYLETQKQTQAVDYLNQTAYMLEQLEQLDLDTADYQELRLLILEQLSDVLGVPNLTPAQLGEAVEASRGSYTPQQAMAWVAALKAGGYLEPTEEGNFFLER